MIQHFTGDFDKLSDVKVERPDKDEIVDALYSLADRIKNAENADDAIAAIKEYFVLFDDIRTSFSLIYIRHTCNVKDPEYSELSDLVDEIGPFISEASNVVDMALYNSKYRSELEEAFGSLFFEQTAQSLKTFSPAIVNDLVEENRLGTQYTNLISSALIDFDGQKLSIPQMGKYTRSSDREVRREANIKVWEFYESVDDQIGDIYDKMVKVRTKMAKTLGYENYVQLGYDRMGRLDWNSADAKEYRDKILTYIVPLSNEIFKDQRERTGYGESAQFYDYSVFYKSGNPAPKGSTDDLVNAAKEMYSELSPVASHYFNFMVDHGCMDLDARPGKAGGGYMDYISGLHTSFIFSNSNGTSDDVDTLTHEFGHSLQGFLGGDQEVPSYRSPGMECCEMHSMSMEFLTYPWMDKFFKEDTEKYRYQHLCDAITFIPYGCIVDAFQTYIYEHPDMTHAERKAYWRMLEKAYLPHLQYDEIPYLESGAWWVRQHHIFENPLYYLDYTIAQVVALEFFSESLKDRDAAFDKYIGFCKLAGTLPFRKLLKAADIANPMDGDTLKNVAQNVVDYLNTFDLENIDK